MDRDTFRKVFLPGVVANKFTVDDLEKWLDEAYSEKPAPWWRFWNRTPVAYVTHPPPFLSQRSDQSSR